MKCPLVDYAHSVLLSFSSYCLLVYASSPVLNDKSLYDVVITKTAPSEERAVAEIALMYNKKGQPFHCAVPEVAPQTSDDNHFDSLSREAIQAALAGKTTNVLGAKTVDCVRLISNEWWHYEYCYSSRVNQFHLTERGTMEPVISLGVFSHDFDWSTVERKDALKRKERYHVQHFVNGSVCDTTGQPRQTRVKLYCDIGKTDHPVPDELLFNVIEPESCHYEISLKTKRLCDIPYFNPKPRTVNQIVCNPATNVPALQGPASGPQPGRVLRKNLMKQLIKRSQKLEHSADADKSSIKIKSTESYFQMRDTGKKLKNRQELVHALTTSRARTFQDVVSEMNPSVRQLRALEKAISEKLSAFPGGMDVRVLDTGGPAPVLPAVSPAQMQQLEKMLLGVLTEGLQEKVSVMELEKNYNSLVKDGDESSDESDEVILDEVEVGFAVTDGDVQHFDEYDDQYAFEQDEEEL